MPRYEYPSLRQGLVFAWKGDAPSTVLSDDTNRSRGVWSGANPTYQFGGVTFDGSGASGTNYFSVTDRTGLSGNTPFTVSAWFRPTGSYGTVCNFGGSATYAMLVRWDAGTNAFTWSGGATIMSATSVVFSGKWYHFSISYPGTTTADALLYVNGAIKAMTGTASALSYSSSATAYIGSFGGTGGFHGGQIADLRIYNRVLAPSERLLIASRRGIGLSPFPSYGGGLARKLSVNVGGTWRAADAYLNVGGVWKLTQASINDNGTWK